MPAAGLGQGLPAAARTLARRWWLRGSDPAATTFVRASADPRPHQAGRPDRGGARSPRAKTASRLRRARTDSFRTRAPPATSRAVASGRDRRAAAPTRTARRPPGEPPPPRPAPRRRVRNALPQRRRRPVRRETPTPTTCPGGPVV